MSISKRLISGSAASWGKIFITLISQVMLVPVYLSYWDASTYGIWLAVQALAAFMTIIDYGHQTYMGYEYLRLAAGPRITLSKNFSSAITAQVFTNVLQFLLYFAFLALGVLSGLLGKEELSTNLLQGAAIVLFLHLFIYTLATSVSGMMCRVLEPFGYQPRIAWWTVLREIITNGSPAVAVILGADLPMAALTLTVASLLFAVPYYYDMVVLMRKHGVRLVKPDVKLMLVSYARSIALTGRVVLEYSRQQGVRVVLAPLLGGAGLTAFSTMRTGSNVALQGLNTITNPLMPDLMRFLHGRDQMRLEAAFGTIWIVVMALLAPGVLGLQAIVEPIFMLWTKGQIPFNPTLFALLSLSVLVFAVAQPAMAIVAGNNLLRPQLILSIVAGILAIGGIVVLVPLIGVEAAGISLLAAESSAALFYTYTAQKWLHAHSLEWPRRSFFKALLSIGIVGASMVGMIVVPTASYGICLLGLLALAWNFSRYWKLLPSIVTNKILSLVSPSVLKKKVSEKLSALGK